MLIDITRGLGLLLEGRVHTGLDRVGLAYLARYGARATALVRYAGRWICLDGADSRKLFDALLESDFSAAPAMRLLIARGIALHWARARAMLMLNTDYTGLDLPAYAATVGARGLRPLFFLHDLLPITHPEFFRSGEDRRHYARLHTICSGTGLLVTNSAATRAALQKEAGRSRWTLPPLVVAPIAPARLPLAEGQRSIAQPYFVVLGTIEPRKNHLLLLHLWRDIVAQFGDNSPRLVIIGQRGWECEQIVDILERSAALRGFVLEQPRCTDAQLSTWLHHAQALLFPSFAEGYGLPLVEALSQGLPVIASNLPVFREIAGNIPEYVDPLDGPRWRQLILEYSQTPSPARQAQLERMRGYVPPTWDEHFAIVDDLIARVMHSAA